ncbi:MAG TPA: nucleotide sugar dehydrogenase [Solirubrobacteraceae bacterium]|nr:nucleotide sugar dehydrogenase [Solirubrobacteraceae bacterium]
MKAVVVALGKVGLPLAAQIARAGHEVVGCDIDRVTVDLVNAAQPPFPGEEGLADALAEVVEAGRLTATTNTTEAVAAGADLVVAVPPLLVDADARPDWTTLDAVLDDIGAGLQPGTTVSIETTVPVGTTRTRVAPALAERSGLRAEDEFFSVFSPERVYSGRVLRDLATYPKLLGGLSATGEARGVELYRSFLPAEVWPMGSAEAAELTKLAETTYRDVNIALANEFARFADRAGVDVDRVIAAANSQPFSHIHRPGVAVGGHCIPVYPRFYLGSDDQALLPATAREINQSMPEYAVDLLEAQLGSVAGERVVVLGVAYRGNVKETAFSGAFGLRDALERRKAKPLATDPLYDDAELRALGFEPWDGGEAAGAILQADHAAYTGLSPADLPGVRAVVDGRGMLDPVRFTSVGVALRRIGGG